MPKIPTLPPSPGQRRRRECFSPAVLLPDGEGLFFRLRRPNNRVDTIMVAHGEVREPVLRIEGGEIGDAVYSTSGHLLYEQAFPIRGIWAVPFSLSCLVVEGEPFLVAPEAIHLSISNEATLVFVSGVRSSAIQLFWVDRNGRLLEPIGPPRENIRDIAISPDGEKVAILGEERGNRDVWVYDVDRGTRARLTLAETIDSSPTWSPSNDVAYSSARGIEVRSADGSGESRLLIANDPTWSKQGDVATTLMSVEVSSGPVFSSGIPQKVFSGDDVQTALEVFDSRRYDVAHDGQRFVIARNVIEGTPRVTAIQQWPALIPQQK